MRTCGYIAETVSQPLGTGSLDHCFPKAAMSHSHSPHVHPEVESFW